MRWVVAYVVSGAMAHADPFAVVDTANQMFDEMPEVQQVEDLKGVCGAGERTNPHLFYCTSDNTIYHAPTFADRGPAAYEIAHLLGHAVQVRHGIADVALREIRQRRDEEAELRGMVERQVNCIAGVLVGKSGLGTISIALTYRGQEPFQNAHWGRNPVDRGPIVSIGIDAVQEWFDTGFEALDVAACTVGEFSSDLLVAAQRSE